MISRHFNIDFRTLYLELTNYFQILCKPSVNNCFIYAVFTSIALKKNNSVFFDEELY